MNPSAAGDAAPFQNPWQREFIRHYLGGRYRCGRSKFRKLLRRTLSDHQRVELCPGLRMELDLSRSNQEFLFWFYEETEPPLQWAIRELLPVGGVMVDCGANSGIMGLLARHHRQARTLFVEPHPRLCQTSRRSLELNRYDSVVVEAAASDQPGSLPLYLNDQNDGSHSLHGSGANTQRIDVRVERLDAILEAQQISAVDLLKIDCEGHDLAVLRGLGAYLHPARTKIIFTEMGEDREAIITLLRDKGYAAFASRKLYIDGLRALQRAELAGRPTSYFTPASSPGGDALWVPQGSPLEALLLELHRRSS